MESLAPAFNYSSCGNDECVKVRELARQTLSPDHSPTRFDTTSGRGETIPLRLMLLTFPFMALPQVGEGA